MTDVRTRPLLFIFFTFTTVKGIKLNPITVEIEVSYC